MPAQLAYVHPPLARPAIRSAPQIEGRERVYRGGFVEVRALLPDFERVPFALGPDAIANRALDTVVRRADFRQGLPAMPVGVVSRLAEMVTHRDVLDAVREAVAGAGVDPAEAELEAVVSDYGRRMVLSVVWPGALSSDEGDGCRLCLRCVNAVDRSTMLRIAPGWCQPGCNSAIHVGGCTEMQVCDRELVLVEEVRKAIAQVCKAAKSFEPDDSM
jgi:hypothetical protein